MFCGILHYIYLKSNLHLQYLLLLAKTLISPKKKKKPKSEEKEACVEFQTQEKLI